jgi:hypothetical protein
MTSDLDERPKIPRHRKDTNTVPFNSETFGLTQRTAAARRRAVTRHAHNCDPEQRVMRTPISLV